MAFCGKCGAQIDEGVAFCPACGAPVEAAPEAPVATPDETYTAPVTSEATGEAPAVEPKKLSTSALVMGILALALPLVLGFLVLVPFAGIIPPLLGVIFGGIAKKKVKACAEAGIENGKVKTGKILGTIGLILSIVGLVGVAIYAIVTVVLIIMGVAGTGMIGLGSLANSLNF